MARLLPPALLFQQQRSNDKSDKTVAYDIGKGRIWEDVA
jgi:hypothetical protein